MGTTEISQQAWNAIKLETQPEFDSLPRHFVMELEDRAQAVIDTGLAEEGESYVAKFDQQVKNLINGQDSLSMAMAAEIPEEVQEELIEEAVEEPPKKKPRKIQVRQPKVPSAPKTIKATTKKLIKPAPRKPVLVKAVAKKK